MLAVRASAIAVHTTLQTFGVICSYPGYLVQTVAKKAATIAGGGVNAFSCYEHGKSKPIAAVVNLFRILDKHPELVEDIR
jgi:hypothetical protein